MLQSLLWKLWSSFSSFWGGITGNTTCEHGIAGNRLLRAGGLVLLLLLVLNYRTLRTLIQYMHPLICNIWPIIICATDDRTKKTKKTKRHTHSLTQQFADTNYAGDGRNDKLDRCHSFFFLASILSLCVNTTYSRTELYGLIPV